MERWSDGVEGLNSLPPHKRKPDGDHLGELNHQEGKERKEKTVSGFSDYHGTRIASNVPGL